MQTYQAIQDPSPVYVQDEIEAFDEIGTRGKRNNQNEILKSFSVFKRNNHLLTNGIVDILKKLRYSAFSRVHTQAMLSPDHLKGRGSAPASRYLLDPRSVIASISEVSSYI